MTDKHTHDKDGACDTLDGCTLGPNEQRGIIEDCGCIHSPCPCDKAECPYYGTLCNLCPLHAAAPTLDTGWQTVTDAFHQMLLNRLSADEIVSRLDTLIDEHDAAIKAAKEDA